MKEEGRVIKMESKTKENLKRSSNSEGPVSSPTTQVQFSSIQSLSHINSLHPHGLQHTRPPCPSPTPRVYSNSCPLSRSWHPTISSSIVPSSSHPQSFPASGSFYMSQFFTSGVSASKSVLLMNIQELISFRVDLLDLLAVQGTLQSLLQHHSSKASILWCSALFIENFIL